MKSVLLGLGLTVFVSGCASVLTGQNQTIDVKASNNKQVDVTLNGESVTTPGTFTVLRDGKEKVIKTSAQNCDSATPVTKSVTPAFFGNIVLGGPLASTTDGATGKMWDYADSVEISCPE